MILDPDGIPCIWAEVDTKANKAMMAIFVVGTGNPKPEHAGHHAGSFVQGSFVWHLYKDNQ